MDNFLEREDTLLTREETEAQREWDEEFRRRKEYLVRQELKSRERRRQVSAKMEELKNRWEGVERRRMVRSRQSMLATPTQMTVTAPTNVTYDGNNNNSNRSDNR